MYTCILGLGLHVYLYTLIRDGIIVEKLGIILFSVNKILDSNSHFVLKFRTTEEICFIFASEWVSAGDL